MAGKSAKQIAADIKSGEEKDPDGWSFIIGCKELDRMSYEDIAYSCIDYMLKVAGPDKTAAFIQQIYKHHRK